MEDFIQILMKNLEKNGFPQKKVAFDLETMYERAENKKLSMNKVLDILKTRGVHHVKKGERIIFKSAPQQSTADAFGGMPNLNDVNPDFLAQAQAMMDNMSEDELSETRNMVQERLASMSPAERSQLFEQIKGMGLG